jgi:flavodoxin
MKALIVYDSVFNNTKKIAMAIGYALGPQKNVGIFHVNDIRPEYYSGLRVLVAGSPTRGFRPTKDMTRFLRNIPENLFKGVRIAAFDTRMSMKDVKVPILHFLVRIFGYAAEPISRKLQKKGGVQVVNPEGFIVKNSEGPLREGELERAAGWARQIKKAVNI